VQELEEVTVGANAGAQIGTTVNVPSGYKILGCLAPSTTASAVACVSLSVNASNNTISGLARNFSGSSATVTISFNVLCVKI